MEIRDVEVLKTELSRAIIVSPQNQKELVRWLADNCDYEFFVTSDRTTLITECKPSKKSPLNTEYTYPRASTKRGTLVIFSSDSDLTKFMLAHDINGL